MDEELRQAVVDVAVRAAELRETMREEVQVRRSQANMPAAPKTRTAVTMAFLVMDVSFLLARGLPPASLAGTLFPVIPHPALLGPS